MKTRKNQTIEIIVRGSVEKVTMETIKKNFHFSETYSKNGKAQGIEENVVYNNLEEYIELLKKGRLKFFNLSLGVSYPFLMVEGGEVNLNKILDFCLEHEISFSVGEIKI